MVLCLPTTSLHPQRITSHVSPTLDHLGEGECDHFEAKSDQPLIDRTVLSDEDHPVGAPTEHVGPDVLLLFVAGADSVGIGFLDALQRGLKSAP